MRGDTRLYIPFAQHFHMDVVYTTTQKYLVDDRKEKQLIRMYQSKPFGSYNIMRGRPSANLLYWMLKKKNPQINNKNIVSFLSCCSFFLPTCTLYIVSDTLVCWWEWILFMLYTWMAFDPAHLIMGCWSRGTLIVWAVGSFFFGISHCISISWPDDLL